MKKIVLTDWEYKSIYQALREYGSSLILTELMDINDLLNRMWDAKQSMDADKKVTISIVYEERAKSKKDQNLHTENKV